MSAVEERKRVNAMWGFRSYMRETGDAVQACFWSLSLVPFRRGCRRTQGPPDSMCYKDKPLFLQCQ